MRVVPAVSRSLTVLRLLAIARLSILAVLSLSPGVSGAWEEFDGQKPIAFHPDRNGWGRVFNPSGEIVYFKQVKAPEEIYAACRELASLAAAPQPLCNFFYSPLDYSYTEDVHVCKAGSACDCDRNDNACRAIWSNYPVPGTYTIEIHICPEGSISMGPWDKCSPVVERWRWRQKKKNRCEAAGNPIYPMAGVKAQEFDTGLGLKGFPLRFTYDSTPLLPFEDPKMIPVSVRLATRKPLGQTWSSSYHRRLMIANTYYYYYYSADRGDGRVIAFPRESGSTVIDLVAQISANTYNYRYYDNADGSIETYEHALLKSRQAADGTTHTFAYSDGTTALEIAPGPDYLISVTDGAGRSVQFRYDAAGKLSTVIGADGLPAALGYTAAGYLATITWPDSKVKTFLYERTDLPGALTGIVNENGVRTSTFTYDAQGRAIGTQRAGGVDSYQVSWGSPPRVTTVHTTERDDYGTVYRDHYMSDAQGVSVTHPNGITSTIASVVADGVNMNGGQSQAAGSGCEASTSHATYDSRGNVTLRDNFDGVRSCFAYHPTRNLETERVEGLPAGTPCADVLGVSAGIPAGARRTTSQWVFTPTTPSLQTRSAAPKVIKTWVYNGQPDPFNGNATANCASGSMRVDGSAKPLLCKVVEQTTADEDGRLAFAAAIDTSVPIKTTSYTYDAAGRVLTVTDPMARVTSYAYYTASTADARVGDLWKVTNPAGHVTTFNKYDANGLPLRSTDPNGLVTTYTYDQRRRLISTSTGSRTTGITYDDAGRTTRVTSPDGTRQQFVYDDADRLVEVNDGNGNKVNYTLDASGNRIGERVTDSSGALLQNITRVFDALNRVQGVTGAPQ